MGLHRKQGAEALSNTNASQLRDRSIECDPQKIRAETSWIGADLLPLGEYESWRPSESIANYTTGCRLGGGGFSTHRSGSGDFPPISPGVGRPLPE